MRSISICKNLILSSILIVSISVSAQNVFTLDKLKIQPVKNSSVATSSNLSYSPFGTEMPISGLSITGLIRKKSPDYFVRVILKDKRGIQYVVAEMYEELNSEELIRLNNYCEETAILENIEPDSIKIYIKDAYLQIDSVYTTESMRDLNAILKQKRISKRSQVNSIVKRINTYNKRNGRPWTAAETELSTLPYDTKKRIMGINDDYNTSGLEYYSGGYFIVGHGQLSNTVTNDPFVDSFDWRNRHGKNWMTSVKHQGWTSYCVGFSVLGCTEALTKLYYNNANLEIDLSEQELASCADTYPHIFNEGLDLGACLDYIHENGVCDEQSYPLNTSYNIYENLTCNSGNIIPNERVRTGVGSSIGLNMHNIKSALINDGPLISGWAGNANESGHAMTLVGYGKIKATDTIYFHNSITNSNDIISIPSSLIGSTYWIFKDSYGTTSANNGYYNLIFSEMQNNNGNVFITSMSPVFSLGMPITTINYTDDDIIIEDADGDGFFNWGIGPKPQNCPVWIPDICDGDDSDSTVGIMDEYGYLSENVLREPWTLSSDFSYGNAGSMTYGNIIIPYGKKLSVTGTLTCMGNASIIVQNGGILEIDSGILANANINLHAGSTITVKNGGIIYMRTDTDLNAPLGCYVNIEDGEIRKPFIKKSTVWDE